MNESSLSYFWTLLCVFLVFFMQAGFALAGTGFTRAKNAGNTIAMNLAAIVIAALGYWICGFRVQHGSGFFVSDSSMALVFLSSVVLVNIATMIPIGAMAERWTFKSFVVYAFFMAMIVYPLNARWIATDGWLAQLGKNLGLGHGVLDYAGSSFIHMTAGFAGLAGAIVLGPRMGKYRANGAPLAIPGHHIPMAITGILILFFGWFGLTSMHAVQDGGARAAAVVMNTLLAGVAAAFSSLCYTWFKFRKPDLSLSASGLLGGLVAISASCAYVSAGSAVVIGALAGVLCCASIFFIERRTRVDDPLGAVSVHGVCGAWGMIGLGLFSNGTSGEGVNGVAGAVTGLFYGSVGQLVAQVIGIAANGIFVFGIMYVFFKLLGRVTMLRVAEEVEFEGLDQNEVSVTAYPDFSISKTRR
jgi:Amt family ammonium transporter